MTTLAMTERRRVGVVLADAPDACPCPTGAGIEEVYGAEEICPGGDEYASGLQPTLIVFLTLQGRAALSIGGQTFLHEPGKIIITSAGCVINERVESDQSWHVLYLMLRGAWADCLSDFLRERRDPPVLALPDAPPHYRQTFTEMFELALLQPDGWRWGFLARTGELFGALFGEAQRASPGDALLQRLAQVLDAAPDARPTPAQLAARLHLSPRQLLYQFRKASDEPLALWIRKRRIAHAARLLGQGQSVTEVAGRLGFANPYHFSRTFKAVTGHPPSAVLTSARRAGLHWRTQNIDTAD